MPLSPRAAAAWLPAALWMALIFALSSQPAPPQPPGTESVPFADKFEHFAAYAILATLLVVAIWNTVDGPLRGGSRTVAALAFAIAVAYAATDEWHQSTVPDRMADPADWAVDALGAAVAAIGLTRGRDERGKRTSVAAPPASGRGEAP